MSTDGVLGPLWSSKLKLKKTNARAVYEELDGGGAGGSRWGDRNLRVTNSMEPPFLLVEYATCAHTELKWHEKQAQMLGC